MSSIGPVTPVAAQLIMGVNQNLNESANRSTQLALGRMTQEGFDKQRVFEGEQNALQREQNERIAAEDWQHRQELQTSAQAHAQKLQADLIAVNQAEKRAALAASEAAARGSMEELTKARAEQARLAQQREELQQDAVVATQLITSNEEGIVGYLNMATSALPDAINEADSHYRDTNDAINLALQGTLGKLAEAPEGVLDVFTSQAGYALGNAARAAGNFVLAGGLPNTTPATGGFPMRGPSAEENVGLTASTGGDFAGSAANVVGTRIAERLAGSGLFRQFGQNEGAVSGALQKAIVDSLNAAIATGRGDEQPAVQGFRAQADASLEALKNLTNKEFVGQVFSSIASFTETARDAYAQETINQDQATGGQSSPNKGMVRLLDSLAGVGHYAQSLGYTKPEGSAAQLENSLARIIAARARQDLPAFEAAVKEIAAREGPNGPSIQKLTRLVQKGLVLEGEKQKQMASKKLLDQKIRELAEQEDMLGEQALAKAALTGASAEREAYDKFVPAGR